MKKLVTHKRPHIDDICAIWLFKRYDPAHADSAIDFIPTNPKGGDVSDDPDIVYIGVGRGEFDEHKGDMEDCASSLVYAHLRNSISIPQQEQLALDKLIAWVLEEDLGKLNALPLREFTVPSILLGYFKASKRDSHKMAELGMAILDGILATLKEQVQIERDWEGRREFTSRFGKAVAVESNAHGIDAFAYRRGYDLIAQVNFQRDYFTVRARADSDIDLMPVYKRIKEMEPAAAWYLHHSGRMLICGGDIQPGTVVSKLNLDDLIELLT